MVSLEAREGSVPESMLPSKTIRNHGGSNGQGAARSCATKVVGQNRGQPVTARS